MDRNPVLQDLHTFHNNSTASYQPPATKVTLPETVDRNAMYSMPTTADTTTSFLDTLDLAGFYQQSPSIPQPISSTHEPQPMYSPNGFYQLSPQPYPQMQQQQPPPQMQNYIPGFQHNQILLQRYNSNGSTTSSTNSQPSYHLPQANYMQYNINQQDLSKMYYQQHLQQHLQQLQQQQQQQQQHHQQKRSHAIDVLEQQAGGIQKKKPKAKKKRAPKVVDPNAPPKPKRKTGLNKPLILSPALSELMDGDKELSRPELVQKLWRYIKTNDLQDPADRRYILCDDKLKKIFDQDRVNSFGMNKDLSAHLTKKEEPLIKEEQGEIEATPIKEEDQEEERQEEKEVVTTAIGNSNSAVKQDSTNEKENGFLLDL